MNRANPTITDLGLLVESDVEWGKYAEAIARHEFMLDRDAPDPTIDCRLSPLFVEWMMGLPPGLVTRFIENRRHALHVLGNRVVPQQAAAAISSVIPAALEVAA